MRFVETSIPGAPIIELEPHEDHRGYFARVFCERSFEAAGTAHQPAGQKRSGDLQRAACGEN